jgi:NADPH:quinone reductase-like Zn-dependent oxidoreductase
MGLEVAGEVVVAAGRWKLGDRVCALLGGGGYAEFAACDARHALPIPKDLTAVEAAALPETVFTVYANVFEGGSLKAGETLLVHGATSGIGVAAIQMGKATGRWPWGPTSPSTLRPTTSKPSPRRPAASMWCWTWSARPISPRISAR